MKRWQWSCDCSGVFAKSVHILGMPFLDHLCAWYVSSKGPGVEFKVHLMSLWQSCECKVVHKHK